MTPAALLKTLEPFLSCHRWWIAYSGGIDSHVLLHLLVQLRKQQKIPALTAIHINHQLNPRASTWVEHCRRVCGDLNIEFITEAVEVINDGDGIEAAARKARYAAFEKRIDSNELLLQAHHRDDQIETLMLRLLRGSGIAGLTAIPAQRALSDGLLLRPLLNYTRTTLLDYARENRLRWIEDDSNDSDRFDRNFLRLNVLPMIEQRWPSYRTTLSRVVVQANESSYLFDDLARVDAEAAINAGGELSLRVCKQLTIERQRNLLRFWFQQKKIPQPSREQLEQVRAMLYARADAQPCVMWPAVEVHRFRDYLHVFPPLPPLPTQPIDIEWNFRQPLIIEGLGQLSTHAIAGEGLRKDLTYRVRNRHGGERCKPAGRAHSQTLKKLLQEFGVPPWLRDRLPLIYCGDAIAAVADLWVCEGFCAEAGAIGAHVDWNLQSLP